jgi:hypothetical protein
MYHSNNNTTDIIYINKKTFYKKKDLLNGGRSSLNNSVYTASTDLTSGNVSFKYFSTPCLRVI